MQHFIVEGRQPTHDALLNQNVSKSTNYEYKHQRQDDESEHISEIFKNGLGSIGFKG